MINNSYIEDCDQVVNNNNNNNKCDNNLDYICDDLAVNVKDVVFGYRKGVVVLNKLSLFVPKGKIFALLGPNGTGKTTLIRAILGRIQLESGIIRVFDGIPGSPKSDIPGKGVGYMPQELALFEELTISEILKYYGNLYHMDSCELSNRVDNLIEILNLPEKSRTISKLSGGQRRRVSIAITMIHKPKLIILDEPTVGVDSILRLRIWQYLEKCCQTYGQTVIITTHYIEEARSASNVAFMSSGIILKQSNPQHLINTYNCQTLEDVFLYLCVNYRNNIIKRNTTQPVNEQLDTTTTTSIVHDLRPNKLSDDNNNENNYKNNEINSLKQMFNIDGKRVNTMLWKYWILTLRRPQFLLLFYVLPLIALTSMKWSIGRKPHHIPVAVYNADNSSQLSKMFLNSIEPYYMSLYEYPTNESAANSVRDGVNTIAMMFKKNFSDNFALRLTDLFDMTDEELDSSQIKIVADFSDSIVGNNVYNSLLRAFEIFLRQLGPTYGHNLYRYFYPVTLEPAIYGSTDLNLNTFILPGLMMALAHLLPMIISAFQIIYDRKNTSLERVLVAGVKPMEFFIAHMVQNILLIISQVFMSMIVAFVIYGNTQLGSYIEVYLLFLLQSTQGMAFGLLASLLLFDEVSVGIGLTGFMFPIWIISGVIWPIQSIPYYFRWIADLSPITQPLEALRCVMLKGWTYNYDIVFNGYLISFVYTIVLSILNMILFQLYSDKALSLSFLR
ncbi:ABC transporter G family member 23-like [Oppia nitens]|uniref:ABC transporter G family member 23-like n=1 Tax=Oppia nitens TaxID=1686743 RepID=UPI0023DA9253|nr:ABC transporter G family member 23-like [Oppia nitens]